MSMALMFLWSITQLINFTFSRDAKFTWMANPVLCDSKMVLWGKCQSDNLWYWSEFVGLLLEPGAVTSTSHLLYNGHIVSVFLTQIISHQQKYADMKVDFMISHGQKMEFRKNGTRGQKIVFSKYSIKRCFE